jgi:hypothetical protein
MKSFKAISLVCKIGFVLMVLLLLPSIEGTKTDAAPYSQDSDPVIHVGENPYRIGVHYQDELPTDQQLGRTDELAWVNIPVDKFAFDGDGGENGEYYWAESSCRSGGYEESYWAIGGGLDGSNLSCGDNYPDNVNSWMIFGPFNLEDAYDARFTTYYWLNSEDENDILFFGASINGGVDFFGYNFSGGIQDWQYTNFDLTSVYQLGDLRGQSEVWIAVVFRSNDSINKSEGAYIERARVQKYVDWTTILYDDFEAEFPGSWDVFDIDGSENGEYYWAKRDCRPFEGNYSAWAVGGGDDGIELDCGDNYPDNANSRMMFGPFSLEDTYAAYLSFDYWINLDETIYEQPYRRDRLCVYAKGDGYQWFGHCFSDIQMSWETKSFNLCDFDPLHYSDWNFCGDPEVYIRFDFESFGNYSKPEGAYIDNVKLMKYIEGVSIPPDFWFLYLPLIVK